MTKLKAWISAARLRTLPLSISGILVGSVLGTQTHFGLPYKIQVIGLPFTKLFFQTSIFWLAIATTLGLQILSNFANDYGDGVKGTDNDDRIGPKRALQSGTISAREMLIGIIVTSIITLFFAIMLIYNSFGAENFGYSLIFFMLGLIAIVSAIKYTVGTSAYGYRGLGDIFVFVFFGLVSVVGCYFLYTKSLHWFIFLPGCAIGLLSTAVLNLNNMRDYFSDKKANKNTLVVKIGLSSAKKYHFFLILGAMISMLIFVYFHFKYYDDLIFLIAFVPLLIHLRKVFNNKQPEELDPELKKVALSTFFLSILFSLGQIL